MQKILFFFLFLILSPVCLAQDSIVAKQTVDNFLQDWLIKKNTVLVENYFARDLFASKYLYFGGGVFFDEFKGIERDNHRQIKRKAIKSLRKFTGRIQGNTIKEILSADEKIYEEGKLLSSPENDLYTLYRMNEFDGNDSPPDKEDIFTYIKSKFPSKDYLMMVVLVKYRENRIKTIDVPVYAIWARENKAWKIVQFGLEPQ